MTGADDRLRTCVSHQDHRWCTCDDRSAGHYQERGQCRDISRRRQGGKLVGRAQHRLSPRNDARCNRRERQECSTLLDRWIAPDGNRNPPDRRRSSQGRAEAGDQAHAQSERAERGELRAVSAGEVQTSLDHDELPHAHVEELAEHRRQRGHRRYRAQAGRSEDSRQNHGLGEPKDQVSNQTDLRDSDAPEQPSALRGPQ